jgi:hypothetical protein
VEDLSDGESALTDEEVVSSTVPAVRMIVLYASLHSTFRVAFGSHIVGSLQSNFRVSPHHCQFSRCGQRGSFHLQGMKGHSHIVGTTSRQQVCLATISHVTGRQLWAC